jgi:UDP-glucose 4-epimerase
MKFLISGGAGFIGSHVAEELIRDKKGEVIIFDNLSVGKRDNVPPGCTFIHGDIRDKKKLSELLKGIDIVFHEAAFVSIRGSFEKLWEDIDTNCLGTLNVLETAIQQGVKKMIFASSMAVYGEPKHLPVDEEHPLNPISPYGLSKVRGEMYCRLFAEKYGIIPIILRYFNTYGTKQTPSPYVGVITTFINQVLEKKPLTIFGDGNQTRDFVWVKDIAHATVLAAFSNVSGVFNIANGTEISINQLADMIIEHLGEGEKIYLDEPLGEIRRMCSDISKARKFLNYEPQGKLEHLLPSLIDWWRDGRGCAGK